MRLFIASDVPKWPDFDDLIKTIRRAERRIKPVGENQIHITYKFLGEVDPDAVNDIENALMKALDGIEAFEATVKGIGVFPDMNRARVIWAGVDPKDPFVEIARRVEEAMAALGFQPEKRSFHPHITLARVKAPHGTGAFRSILREMGNRRFMDFRVESVILKKSVLKPSGPEYSDVFTVVLGNQ